MGTGKAQSSDGLRTADVVIAQRERRQRRWEQRAAPRVFGRRLTDALCGEGPSPASVHETREGRPVHRLRFALILVALHGCVQRGAQWSAVVCGACSGAVADVCEHGANALVHRGGRAAWRRC